MEDKKNLIREVVITTKGVRRVFRPIPQPKKNKKHIQAPPGKSKKKEPLENGRIRCKRCFRPFYENSVPLEQKGFCRLKCKRRWDKAEKKKQNARLRTYQEKYFSPVEKKQMRQVRRIENKNLGFTGFYASPAWRDLRYGIMRKYKFTCCACGRNQKIHGVVIHVDHIKPRSKYPGLELDPDNLQLLCEDCNLGKSNFSEDDLRPY